MQQNARSVQVPVETAQQRSNSMLIYYYDELFDAWIAVPTQQEGSMLTANIPEGSWVAVMDIASIYQPADTVANWANSEIMKLISLNIVQGYEDQTFKPNEVTNRTEIAVVLARALKLDIADTDTSRLDTMIDSSDIPAWARPYWAAILNQGIMIGGEKGIDGKGSLTRAQMSVIIGRILSGPTTDATVADLPFSDRGEIPQWAMEGAQKALEAGILKGYPDGSFQPTQPLTRAEMAAIMTRLLNYLAQQQGQD